MTTKILSNTLRRWLSDARYINALIKVLIATVTAIVLAISGPFGTFQAGALGDRFWYWFVVLIVSILLGVTLKSLVFRVRGDSYLLLREIVTISLFTIIFTPFLWGWTFWSYQGVTRDPLPMIWMGQCVLVISLAASFMTYAIPLMMENSQTPAGLPARILKRLPDDFEGKILHLAVEDHIVQLITSTGVFDLRMRFCDAVEEVSELAGCYSHRSHWVVIAEIESVERVNGRPCLLMSSGKTVPVSRKYQPELEVLGVL